MSCITSIEIALAVGAVVCMGLAGFVVGHFVNEVETKNKKRVARPNPMHKQTYNANSKER